MLDNIEVTCRDCGAELDRLCDGYGTIAGTCDQCDEVSMSIQDDYFNIKTALHGTRDAIAFSRLSDWVFKLEEDSDTLAKRNSELEQAIKTIQTVGLPPTKP